MATASSCQPGSTILISDPENPQGGTLSKRQPGFQKAIRIHKLRTVGAGHSHSLIQLHKHLRFFIRKFLKSHEKKRGKTLHQVQSMKSDWTSI